MATTNCFYLRTLRSKTRYLSLEVLSHCTRYTGVMSSVRLLHLRHKAEAAHSPSKMATTHSRRKQSQVWSGEGRFAWLGHCIEITYWQGLVRIIISTNAITYARAHSILLLGTLIEPPTSLSHCLLHSFPPCSRENAYPSLNRTYCHISFSTLSSLSVTTYISLAWIKPKSSIR
jgi:hypothetical protein